MSFESVHRCNLRGFPDRLVGKESACSAGDLGSIPGSGKFQGEKNGQSLQYACLDSLMVRGAWQALVHGIAKVGYDLATIQRNITQVPINTENFNATQKKFPCIPS